MNSERRLASAGSTRVTLGAIGISIEAKVTCNVPDCPTPAAVAGVGVSKYGVGAIQLPGGWVWDSHGAGVYCAAHAVPKLDE
jgi:hypothetical protein